MQRILNKGERLKKIRRQLAAKNRKFNKLSTDQQRIAIAKDVILQLAAKKFVAASTYFNIGNKFDEEEQDTEPVNLKQAHGMELSECIAQVGCTVCGVGSLFASAVLNHDKIKANVENTYWLSPDITIARSDEIDYLSQWFSHDQLDQIERYFEGECACELANYESPIRQEDDDNKRLRMIMENIVSNDGIFNPYTGEHAVPNALTETAE